MTTDTTKAPHCPRCGGELVHRPPLGKWYVRCAGCDFHIVGDEFEPAYGDGVDAQYVARRLVRAELARQALEMWTSGANDISYDVAQRYVLTAYNWLGEHPLRLPGEEA